MKRKITAVLLSAVMVLSGGTFSAADEVKIAAFPGAEGGGMYTSGGRGCEVYIVDTLEDYVPDEEEVIKGSLRDALSGSDRTIVFNVSGVIDLKAPMDIHGKNLTIAGQTAPGNGITLYGYQTNMSNAENVIMRYLRFRAGAKNVHKGDSMDALWGRCMKDIIVDHVSTSWSTDETMSLYRAENMTVQWSIIAESLAMSGHTKGRHGYGAIWGGVNATFHHNLIADHTSRNPRIGGGTPEADDNEHIGLCDIRNNVIYNWGFNTCYGGGRCNTNFVYNYAKAGKGTREEVKERLIDCGEKNKPGGFYVNGNVLEGNDGISSDNSKGIYISEANAPFTTISDKEFEMEGIKNIKTDEPKEAYEKVLKMAGAVYPKRDAADARIIAQVKNDTGSFANVDNQLGGLPYREEIKRSDDFDKDKDGIEDEWEIKNGLDPTDSDDSRKMSKDGSGYTNIENYINSLVEMEHEAENSAIKITEPANNAIYAVGSAVNIKAECDDDVKKVIFCNGEEVIGEDDEKPFEMKLTGLKDGTYYISAKAVNERGEETASDASAVHINTYALSGWLQTDIGKPNISGNASYENGVYTVKGSGKVQGKSDDFCFMYNTMSGDGEISAKIESITAVDNHALSGLMIRESLAEDAAEVGIGLSHTKPYEWKEKDDETGKETTYYRNAFGVYMFSRDKKGENVDELAENLDSLEAAEKSGVALEKDIPFKEYDKFLGYYVKLKREGDTFTSYTSRDGVQWQQLSVKTVEMGKTVCIGIAVDGNKVNNELDNLNTAKFSEVKFINY